MHGRRARRRFLAKRRRSAAHEIIPRRYAGSDLLNPSVVAWQTVAQAEMPVTMPTHSFRLSSVVVQSSRPLTLADLHRGYFAILAAAEQPKPPNPWLPPYDSPFWTNLPD